jgi:hypothetical protein
MEQPTSELGLRAARKLVEASDDEWPKYFVALRRDKQLSTAIREINQLLDQPKYRQLAIDALRRVGLWDSLALAPRTSLGERAMRDQAPQLVRYGVLTNNGLAAELGHLLEVDEPMAAAGAQLSGLHIKTETEQALIRATREEEDHRQEASLKKRPWFGLALAVGLAILVFLALRMTGATG